MNEVAQVVSFGCEVVVTFFETFGDGQDRAELVLMYRRANQELSRLRAGTESKDFGSLGATAGPLGCANSRGNIFAVFARICIIITLRP